MKNKSFLIFSFLILILFSCKEREKNSDFTSTEKGFRFKHCVENKTSPKVKVGDIILLLTDGAHKVMSPEQIKNIVVSAGNCYDTCNGIIDGANLLGGPDNISVCISYIPN